MASLRKVFKTMDTEKTGFVTTENIEKALKQMDITAQEIQEIFKSLTHGAKDNKINYSTFLAATIDRKKTLTLQNLQFAFHHFDTKNSGEITREDMVEVCRREGRTMTDEDLQEMFGGGTAMTFDRFTKSMMEVMQKENADAENMDLS